ncbi:hypothetical protein KBI23_13470 [bacterium]|nr:hypothetical protein [bacterium]MBP9808555.1 hypothetical protein [bacterium]
MFASTKSTTLALGVAMLLSQSVAFADETSSTSIKTETPLGSASTSVKVKSNAASTTKTVKRASANAVEAKQSTYHAEVGAGGAKVSHEKDAVRANSDGSVTSERKKESHVIGIGGSAHKKSRASTTVGAYGSSTSVKEEQESTTP